MFAGETYALGVATYSGLAFAFPTAYLTGWVLWTDSMYRVLECVDRYGRRNGRGGGKCSVNPKLCTGGGGSTF
jgi:hypothetical protein